LLEDLGLYADARSKGAFYAWGPISFPFYSHLIDSSESLWCRFLPRFSCSPARFGFPTLALLPPKAYDRAVFLIPPACAVGEPAIEKCGGRKLSSFILKRTLHRYFCNSGPYFSPSSVARRIKGCSSMALWLGVGSLILLFNVDSAFLTLHTLVAIGCANFARRQARLFSLRDFRCAARPRVGAGFFLHQ